MVQARQAMVAVLNSSRELIALMQQVLEEEGFATAAAHVPQIQRGKEDFLAFMSTHDPAVVIYDVCPPYEENWTFLRLLMDTEVATGRQFLVLTTNKAVVDGLATPDFAPRVIGKPFDLEEIIGAVHGALGRRH